MSAPKRTTTPIATDPESFDLGHAASVLTDAAAIGNAAARTVSIFPRDPGISFEYHLAGAIIGVLLAFILRNFDSKPQPERYDWQDEIEDDDITGVDWREKEP